MWHPQKPAVRGHGSSPNHQRPAGAGEPSTTFTVRWLTETEVASIVSRNSADQSKIKGPEQLQPATNHIMTRPPNHAHKTSNGNLPKVPPPIPDSRTMHASTTTRLVPYYEEEERKYISEIRSLPLSDEVRVISFGLYGKNPKYLVGASRNLDLAQVYFPGWRVRFYASSDVPIGMVN